MTDPITLAIAAAVAAGATRTGESLGEAAQAAAVALVAKVRARFRGSPDEAVLEQAEAEPEPAEGTTGLAMALERAMAADPGFAADVGNLWSQVRTDAVASGDAVVNNFSGQAETSIQLRDLHGGLTIN
ncbi:MAG: hypothetical protein ABIS86_18820 [Streptosporangiaceae bacterium]